VAFNLALNYPDKVGKLIIMSGTPYYYYASQVSNGSWTDWEHENIVTPEQRGKIAEAFWAPQYFKTLLEETWDANMYPPEDYCIDPSKANEIFKQATEVPLQVMIRYFIEYMTYDLTTKCSEIKVPTLVLTPDFYGLATDNDSSKSYLEYHFNESWRRVKEGGNPMLHFQSIKGSRIFMWYDNPVQTYAAISNFIKGD
jgi:pimeloyl-ACP methyl ester carboxylesterase